MARAELCPVCGGLGKVAADMHSTDAADQECHGCSGKGWVTVDDTISYPGGIPYPNIDPVSNPYITWSANHG
jgi:DnaJ-class molecular chaperone